MFNGIIRPIAMSVVFKAQVGYLTIYMQYSLYLENFQFLPRQQQHPSPVESILDFWHVSVLVLESLLRSSDICLVSPVPGSVSQGFPLMFGYISRDYAL